MWKIVLAVCAVLIVVAVVAVFKWPRSGRNMREEASANPDMREVASDNPELADLVPYAWTMVVVAAVVDGSSGDPSSEICLSSSGGILRADGVASANWFEDSSAGIVIKQGVDPTTSRVGDVVGTFTGHSASRTSLRYDFTLTGGRGTITLTTDGTPCGAFTDPFDEKEVSTDPFHKKEVSTDPFDEKEVST